VLLLLLRVVLDCLLGLDWCAAQQSCWLVQSWPPHLLKQVQLGELKVLLLQLVAQVQTQVLVVSLQCQLA
jgi:hypothetical protein